MEDEQRIDKIKIREEEKMNFKQHLLWIILKMSGQKSEKFYLYDFEAESPVKKLKFDMPQYTTEGEEIESKIIKNPNLNDKFNLNDWLFDANGFNHKIKAAKNRRMSSSSKSNCYYNFLFLLYRKCRRLSTQFSQPSKPSRNQQDKFQPQN